MYTPKPIDTSSVKLDSSLTALAEMLAENNHEVWAAGRIARGWTYGEKLFLSSLFQLFPRIRTSLPLLAFLTLGKMPAADFSKSLLPIDKVGNMRYT